MLWGSLIPLCVLSSFTVYDMSCLMFDTPLFLTINERPQENCKKWKGAWKICQSMCRHGPRVLWTMIVCFISPRSWELKTSDSIQYETWLDRENYWLYKFMMNLIEHVATQTCWDSFWNVLARCWNPGCLKATTNNVLLSQMHAEAITYFKQFLCHFVFSKATSKHLKEEAMVNAILWVRKHTRMRKRGTISIQYLAVRRLLLLGCHILDV